MGFSVFLVLITIVCFLLVLVIMVQNPKGGGLSSSFGGTQQLGGYQKTSDFLDKSTWTLGIILIVLILLSNLGEFNQGNTITIDSSGVTPVQTTPAPLSTPATEETSATEESAE
ncbi:MAG: preprotein translocase subunit SecG [Flavobacteriaceae bacterium]|jgi:preprotein translocase subunit SecG|nr:preprotein translocase subunit SecG [Flavobacteriaceae bacterium]